MFVSLMMSEILTHCAIKYDCSIDAGIDGRPMSFSMTATGSAGIWPRMTGPDLPCLK